MDARQKKLEKKKKRREKIRKEHLEAERTRKKAELKMEFVASKPISYGDLPHKDDSLGWARHNALATKKIFAKAKEMFPSSRELKRLEFSERLSGKDCRELSMLLTTAAWETVWDFPFYIPAVSVSLCPGGRDGVDIKSFTIQMEHESIPKLGTIWHSEHDGKCDIVWYNRKGYQMCWSRHALDRLKERLEFFCSSKIMLVSVFTCISPLCILKVGVQHVVPIAAFYEDVGSIILGYCPVDVCEHRIVAKTFLLPFLRGTPEYQLLEANGMGHVLRECKSMCDYEAVFKHAIVALSELRDYQRELIMVEPPYPVKPWLDSLRLRKTDNGALIYVCIPHSKIKDMPEEERLAEPLTNILCEGLKEALAS